MTGQPNEYSEPRPTVCGQSQAMEQIKGDIKTREETARLLLQLVSLSDFETEEA